MTAGNLTLLDRARHWPGAPRSLHFTPRAVGAIGDAIGAAGQWLFPRPRVSFRASSIV